MAYLSGFFGQPLAARNFSRLLVDSEHAGLECFTNNEFDPQDWRSGQALQAEAEMQQGMGQDLQQNLTDDLLPPAAGIGRKGAGPGGKGGLELAERADSCHCFFGKDCLYSASS